MGARRKGAVLQYITDDTGFGTEGCLANSDSKHVGRLLEKLAVLFAPLLGAKMQNMPVGLRGIINEGWQAQNCKL